MVRPRRLWRDYSLSVVLAALFVASWVGQAIVQWLEYRQEQADHHQAATVAGWLVVFGRATLENWQSEFLQLLTFVTLTALLVHRGSPESKDGQEEIRAALLRIEGRLRAQGHTDRDRRGR